MEVLKMEKVLVLGHDSPFDFTDEKSDKRVAGVYIYTTDVTLINYQGKKGFLPAYDRFDPSVISSLTEVPGIYEVTRVNIPNRKTGKTESVIAGFKFVKSFKFEV
jgi:hypothetical protein